MIVHSKIHRGNCGGIQYGKEFSGRIQAGKLRNKFVVYAENGVNMEETVTDPMTGEEYIQMVNVPQLNKEQAAA